MARDNYSSNVVSFAVGLGIGAVVALLLAPKSGEEFRGQITDGASDSLDQATTAVRKLTRRAQKIVNEAADRLNTAVDAGESAFNDAKH
jgi:gas vesicle protein